MWTCPKCERELGTANQWHDCVKVNIGDLFSGKNVELEFVFDKLLSTIIDWDSVAVSATKNCIVFVHHKTFLIVRPMKTQLDLKFYSATEQIEAPIIKSVIWNAKFENHVRISNLEQLDPNLYSLIKTSYKLS
ncbi:hypothetical protein CJD36_017475 [Flavipsychrobacter stenotrophus]|uniref:DUF5655 domain-containing protein n=1 Tax=Flavipsychrobacter stenotrophus TaxID=2077091 RepID=A0A2S7SS38_9BACT|nr:hypothetical protein CJD36_017475 [Flavipsychrobacter stenotrophus]